MGSGSEPIEDDELLYRRIPTSWYDAKTGVLNSQAFGPNKTRDTTGLSVTRAKHASIEVAARGLQPGKSFFVAVLRAGDLRQHGIEVVPRPDFPGGHDPAHAELPDLNSENRKEDLTLERQRILAEKLILYIKGPFPTPVGESP